MNTPRNAFDFDYWAKLYQQDPVAYEAARRQFLDQNLDLTDPKTAAVQEQIDIKRKYLTTAQLQADLMSQITQNMATISKQIGALQAEIACMDSATQQLAELQRRTAADLGTLTAPSIPKNS